MKKARGSLKAQNSLGLNAILAANLVVFVLVVRAQPILELGLKGLWTAGEGAGWMAVAGVVMTILNGLVSAPMKARLVFLRWRDALPGHRAFSVHGPHDARVDMAKVEALLGGTLPQGAAAENTAWYALINAHKDEITVAEVHKHFLYARDYTALALLALVVLGPTCVLLARGSFPSWVYVAGLAAQLVLARQAAATYGVRFVGTVLARATTASPAAPKGGGRKKKQVGSASA